MTALDFHRVQRGVMRRLLGPRILTVPEGPIIRLGSKYGGWSFLDRPELVDSTVISCGLGEDASFDVEFACRYSASILIVDPTPRAISHFANIQSRIGLAAETNYSTSGYQDPSSYDLRDIRPGQLNMIECAVSDHVGTAYFYAPTDESHVSYSLTNFQNDYSDSTPSIEVETIDIPTLIKRTRLQQCPLIKIDIEGAESRVLSHMVEIGFRPEQVLVEYDEMLFPSRQSSHMIRRTHAMMLKAGYEAVHFDGRSCVSYLKAR